MWAVVCIHPLVNNDMLLYMYAKQFGAEVCDSVRVYGTQTCMHILIHKTDEGVFIRRLVSENKEYPLLVFRGEF